MYPIFASGYITLSPFFDKMGNVGRNIRLIRRSLVGISDKEKRAMKKLYIGFLAAVLAVMLAACGGGSSVPDTPADVPPVEEAPVAP
jgi:hypothetical protein